MASIVLSYFFLISVLLKALSFVIQCEFLREQETVLSHARNGMRRL